MAPVALAAVLSVLLACVLADGAWAAWAWPRLGRLLLLLLVPGHGLGRLLLLLVPGHGLGRLLQLSVLLACVLAALFSSHARRESSKCLDNVRVCVGLLDVLDGRIPDGGQVHVQPFFCRLQQELLKLINAALRISLSASRLSLQSPAVN